MQIIKPKVFIFEGINHLPVNIHRQVSSMVEFMTNFSHEDRQNKVNGIICFGQQLPELQGLFPANIPILTSDKLQDTTFWDCFLTKLYTLQRLDGLYNELTHHNIIQFHSCHKYLIMAYSPVGYQYTGRLVASIKSSTDLVCFFNQYKACLMEILATVPARNTEVNALSHMQGYFKHKATKDEKKRLLWLINDYLAGNLPLNRPLEMMKQLLIQYPDNYLIEQVIFEPYPNSCSIRELPYCW
ncbi:YbgA family protein [Providencia hangzhouensis]|uniref:YbgA family protein n=1 Tax=Providencia hangzhouensis TaxID=3031799 RepID=UPI0024AA203B